MQAPPEISRGKNISNCWEMGGSANSRVSSLRLCISEPYTVPGASRADLDDGGQVHLFFSSFFFFSLIVDRTSFKTAGPSAAAAEHDKRILPERCIHLRRDADSAAIMQGEPPEKIFAGQRSTIHGPHGSCCVGYSADTRTPRTGPVTLFSDRLGEDRKGGSSSKIQIQIQDPGKPKTRTKALQVDSARNHLHPSASTGLRMVPRVEIHACLSLEVQVLRRGPWPGPGKHRRQQRSHLQREKGRAVEQKKTLRKSCGRKSTVQERREKKKKRAEITALKI